MCNIMSLDCNDDHEGEEPKSDLEHRYQHRQTTIIDQLRKMENHHIKLNQIIIFSMENLLV